MFFFTLSDPDYYVYMGKDKYENEKLIRWGWPEDLWFHVDALSSAHVYLRLKAGTTWDDIPASALEECAQLVKENSIKGCKLPQVTIVYTPWSNLKKTGDMADGQVAFHDDKLVKKMTVKKNNLLVKKLEKSRREEFPDVEAMRKDRDAREVREKKQYIARQQKEAKELEAKRKADKDARSYDNVMTEDNMKSNASVAAKYDSVQAFEDDFM